VPKARFGWFREYLIDWFNAIRFLWHVFTARVKSRDANNAAFRSPEPSLSRSIGKDR
jgi:hypothetical protein